MTIQAGQTFAAGLTLILAYVTICQAVYAVTFEAGRTFAAARKGFSAIL
ncbi:MAG: hypothetical protein GY784_19065 [Gammaproteobacteria bacterium]|nr:hypothetical protein [Gammaproteobacteria bacterium]